ncbi:MAG: endonuclease/exonuclease/phosphatase family protein [Chloroflexota bacterium]|nr:endonuclease/exonuclease/phosphatase family protein [Chloroflexota bacterium]
MKVMTYNILEGGNLRFGDRTELLFDIIERADPDILGLCECTGFDEERATRFKYFRSRLRMDGSMTKAPSGHHVCIFSRRGLRTFSRTNLANTMYNGFARVAFESKELGPVTVVMTHLHPFSSWYRVTEVQQVLGRARSSRESIIMGDMNNLAPSDMPFDLEAAGPQLAGRLSGPDGQVDLLPIQAILTQGFVDLGASAVGPTYPTRIERKQKESNVTVRLDYIFATPSLASRCRSIRAVDESPSHEASDHLPVLAEFDLTPLA